jgi:hypothetical protein
MKLVIKNKKFRLPKLSIPKLHIDVGMPSLDFAIPKVVTNISIGGNFKKMAGISCLSYRRSNCFRRCWRGTG